MRRIVKSKEERRMEIIITAQKLFKKKGYENTAVDDITNEMEVAKGTFYYYFESKKDVLRAIVDHELDRIVEAADQLASDMSMNAITKMKLLLSGNSMGNKRTKETTDYLHNPANRELHEISNIQTVLRLSPVFEKIIRQGNRESVFDVKRPLETIQFLITGVQFLTDGGLFDFSKEELKERRIVIQEIIEKSLGSKKGEFNFLNK